MWMVSLPKSALSPPLLTSFDQLNEEGQTKAVEYVEDLVLTGRYKKCSAPGLGAEEA